MANLSLTASAVLEPTRIGKAILLGLSFQPRCKVDAVAEHRIVEPQVGAHIANNAGAGVEADADVDRNIRVATFLGLKLAHLVQPLDPLQHIERGPRRR